MEYRTVAEAKKMPGLRLVLSMGLPGPWGEAAKGVFHAKGIPFIPVGQYIGGDNADLLAWTGVRNAPVAVLDAEKPVDRWIDIIMLAERMKSEPRLLPTSSDDRALVIGIINEICGGRGLGWWRRAMLMVVAAKNDKNFAERAAKEYGCTPEAIAAAPVHIAEILTMLAKRLKAQQALGSPYLVGANLTAADVYWACFSSFLDPLPKDLNPITDQIRAVYSTTSAELDAAKDSILFTHRDFIYRRYLKLPMDF